MNSRFDITEVTKLFHRGAGGKERAELMTLMQEAVNHNDAVKRLLIEVCENAVNNGHGPVGIAKLGFIYGAVLGVFLERERRERELKEGRI